VTPLPDGDVSVGHSFGLELDGVDITGIAEVSGLKMEQDVIELKQTGADGEAVIRKLPGRWKAGEITLTRGLTSDSGFATWVKQSRDGKAAGSGTGAITVFDREGAPVRRLVFANPWPRSLEILPVTIGGTVTLGERLVLVCEELTPE
jgi:phage tail-like protein